MELNRLKELGYCLIEVEENITQEIQIILIGV